MPQLEPASAAVASARLDRQILVTGDPELKSLLTELRTYPTPSSADEEPAMSRSS